MSSLKTTIWTNFVKYVECVFEAYEWGWTSGIQISDPSQTCER